MAQPRAPSLIPVTMLRCPGLASRTRAVSVRTALAAPRDACRVAQATVAHHFQQSHLPPPPRARWASTAIHQALPRWAAWPAPTGSSLRVPVRPTLASLASPATCAHLWALCWPPARCVHMEATARAAHRPSSPVIQDTKAARPGRPQSAPASPVMRGHTALTSALLMVPFAHHITTALRALRTTPSSRVLPVRTACRVACIRPASA
jgi:hypothetical protein